MQKNRKKKFPLPSPITSHARGLGKRTPHLPGPASIMTARQSRFARPLTIDHRQKKRASILHPLIPSRRFCPKNDNRPRVAAPPRGGVFPSAKPHPTTSQAHPTSRASPAPSALRPTSHTLVSITATSLRRFPIFLPPTAHFPKITVRLCYLKYQLIQNAKNLINPTSR
jgi:hypothetical protein